MKKLILLALTIASTNSFALQIDVFISNCSQAKEPTTANAINKIVAAKFRDYSVISNIDDLLLPISTCEEAKAVIENFASGFNSFGVKEVK